MFIGLPDGEVFLYHLTRDLTKAPTIHLLPTTILPHVPPMRCCDAGKRRLLYVPLGAPLLWGGWEVLPDGEVFGEMSGEVLAEHLTIQTPL